MTVLKRSIAGLGLAMLAGCAVPPPVGSTPVATLKGPIPIQSETPVSAALRCLGKQPRPATDLRLAVGEIPDRTGRFNYDDIGAYMTQGGTQMMISALAQAKVPQVNRSTTHIAEFELAQALQQRLGEGRPIRVGDRDVAYRPIPKGALVGSTHYVTGAITELDFKVADGGAGISIGGIGVGGKYFAVQIGIDLAVTDTRTSRIVYANSWRKQAIGFETTADVFRFFDLGINGGAFAGDVLFDISIGEQPTEPLQGAVRWALQSAAYDIVSALYQSDDSCDRFLTQAARENRASERALLQQVAAPAAPVADGEPLNAVPVPETARQSPQPGATPGNPNCRPVNGRMVCD